MLVVGGGYEQLMNNSGNRLFVIDAASGRLLWSAGGASSGDGAAVPDLVLARMRYPVAARVNAVDTDSDGFADRLYAADLGGQVWRFDIWNGEPRSTLVTGGVLASLGSANPSPSTALEAPSALPAGADARRFFAAPDAALIWFQGYGSYYNIAIGSGDAAASTPQPLSLTIASTRSATATRSPRSRNRHTTPPFLSWTRVFSTSHPRPTTLTCPQRRPAGNSTCDPAALGPAKRWSGNR